MDVQKATARHAVAFFAPNLCISVDKRDLYRLLVDITTSLWYNGLVVIATIIFF
jgi:hypothetical protein